MRVFTAWREAARLEEVIGGPDSVLSMEFSSRVECVGLNTPLRDDL